VVRVIDAETIALDDGTEVRLIGALPSQGPDPASDRPAIAALEDAVRGRSVELRYAGRRSDRYGRRLAQTFAIDGDAKVWLQGQLVEGGHARAYALPGNEACLKDLLKKDCSSERTRAVVKFALSRAQFEPNARVAGAARRLCGRGGEGAEGRRERQSHVSQLRQ
jgi:endonuclease YncB( thermonuclease family)